MKPDRLINNLADLQYRTDPCPNEHCDRHGGIDRDQLEDQDGFTVCSDCMDLIREGW